MVVRVIEVVLVGYVVASAFGFVLPGGGGGAAAGGGETRRGRVSGAGRGAGGWS
jgi:hypothetical protein